MLVICCIVASGEGGMKWGGREGRKLGLAILKDGPCCHVQLF